MMSARSLFIMSVVKPDTELFSHLAPPFMTSSPNAFSAAPSAPAVHWDITLTRGSADAGVATRHAIATIAPTLDATIFSSEIVWFAESAALLSSYRSADLIVNTIVDNLIDDDNFAKG
jgi:hypothetical protein